MEQFQDVELVSDGKIISCHKLILALHSEYFRTFFSKNMSSFEEVDRNCVEIVCKGPNTMKRIKEFLYTGEIEEVTRDDGISLLEAFTFFMISDEFGILEDLIKPYENDLDEYERELLVQYRIITQILSRRAARIQSSLDNSTGDLSDLSEDELNIAADLVTTGYLTEDLMKKLATRIQSSWSRYNFKPSVAEVRLAATLAATGRLTEVEYMSLHDLDLTGINISSLASGVRQRVWLRSVTGDVATLLSSLNCRQLWMDDMELDQTASCSGVTGEVLLMGVTGDVAPLLSSLTCTQLLIDNMELNQSATRGLVQGLKHGVKRMELQLGDWGPDTLDIQTLVEYDGRGRCGEVECYNVTSAAYREEIKTWAGRINWDVTGEWLIEMRRRDDDDMEN